MARDKIEYDDIQGLVFSGYGTRMCAAAYHLLQFGDPARARTWVRELDGRVTPAVPPHAIPPSATEGFCLNVAFTRSGLEQLVTLNPDKLDPAFRDGMTSDRRRRILGDADESAPAKWDWGGPGKPRIDVLLLLYAPDRGALDSLELQERKRYE